MFDTHMSDCLDKLLASNPESKERGEILNLMFNLNKHKKSLMSFHWNHWLLLRLETADLSNVSKLYSSFYSYGIMREIFELSNQIKQFNDTIAAADAGAAIKKAEENLFNLSL